MVPARAGARPGLVAARVRDEWLAAVDALAPLVAEARVSSMGRLRQPAGSFTARALAWMVYCSPRIRAGRRMGVMPLRCPAPPASPALVEDADPAHAQPLRARAASHRFCNGADDCWLRAHGLRNQVRPTTTGPKWRSRSQVMQIADGRLSRCLREKRKQLVRGTFVALEHVCHSGLGVGIPGKGAPA